MRTAASRVPQKPQPGMGTKWLAGSLLGFPLAVALCALAVIGLPGSWQSGAVAALLACLPLWVAIISAALLFRSSRAAWFWLAVADVAAYAALWAWRLLAAGTA